MITELLERIEALEARLDQTVRVGVVVSTDPDRATVRVALPDAGGMVSNALPVLYPKTLEDKFYWMPDVGEHVVCVFLPCGLEQGFVVGAFYSSADAVPVAGQDLWHVRFRDGSFFQHDRASSRTDLRSEGLLHLSGEVVHTHADERLIRETHGYGDALVHDGGTSWRTETWHDGATLAPSTEHGIQPPEVASGAFAAVKAAILASPDCTDTDRLLLCIPDIAEAQGWVELSAFLRKWFAAPASTDKDAAEPSFVEWDWLKIYPETATALTTIRNREYLFSPAAEAALFNQMKKDHDGVLPDVPVAFDHTVLPVEQLHERQFQFVTVDYGLSSEINGLVAGMGEFTIYAVAKGAVVPLGTGHRITVTGVSLFVRDGFDFEGWQLLGDWNCEGLRFKGAVCPNVENSDFRAYRERHGFGGDFYVYAHPNPLENFEKYSYDVE